MKETIQTERLLLKVISPAVIHDLFKTRNEEEIRATLGVDEKGYLHYKEMHEKGMDTHRHSLFYFLLINKATQEPIGECGFHTWNRIHRRAELFYLLRNDAYKGKGLMKEALTPVLHFGFEELGLHRIEALVGKENIPSVKLIEGAGFRFEGIMREDYVINDRNVDSHCYSLLRHEWRGGSETK